MSLPVRETLPPLTSIILAVTDAGDLDSALGLVLQKICEATHWVYGQAWLRSKDAVLRCSPRYYAGRRGLTPFRDVSERTTFAQGVGLPGRAWSSKEPVWVRDVTVDKNFPRAEVARQVGLCTGVAIPIVAEVEVVAVIEFFMAELHDEDEVLVGVVRAVAAELGLVVRRKAAEDELRASELRLRSLVESAKDAIVSAGLAGDILTWNRGAETIFGYRAEEVVGEPLTILMPERYRDAHKRGLARFQNTGEGRVLGRTLEIHGLRKNGNEFPCELSLNAWTTREGQFFTGIIRDITERKTAQENENRLVREQARGEVEQEAARSAAARFRILAQASRAFTEASLEVPSLLETIARRVMQALGDVSAIRVLVNDRAHVHVVTQDGADPETRALLERLFGEGTENVGHALNRRVTESGAPYRLSSVFGAELRASLSPGLGPYLDELGVHTFLAVPLRSGDGITGSIAVARTSPGRSYALEDQTLLEELRDRAALAIHNASLHEDLRVAVQARDDFLAVAGHELKTPLAAFMMQVQSLLRAVRRNPGISVGDRLEKAITSGLRLERLVSQLLDISRITAGKLHLELEPVDLAAVVTEVVGRFTDASAKPNGPIALRCEKELVGSWDRLRIEHVVNNLVSNAVKYGSGKAILVDLHSEGAEAVLSVQDHGIGIDEEHQKKIFQRFERAVATRDYGGFGLGLWISRQMVEANGGRIAVRSTPGQGSTFTVRLPVRREQDSKEVAHGLE